MHFKLICLYKDSVAIDKDKLAEASIHIGNLVIEDWVEGNAFKRPVRYTRLMTETHMVPSDIIPHLFEPIIVKMTTKQMTLMSYQMDMRTGAAVHYMQNWAVRMIARDEPH